MATEIIVDGKKVKSSVAKWSIICLVVALVIAAICAFAGAVVPVMLALLVSAGVLAALLVVILASALAVGVLALILHSIFRMCGRRGLVLVEREENKISYTLTARGAFGRAI